MFGNRKLRVSFRFFLFLSLFFSSLSDKFGYDIPPSFLVLILAHNSSLTQEYVVHSAIALIVELHEETLSLLSVFVFLFY